jgi:hypothetical protein
MELGLNNKQYYWFIRPQDTPLEQEEDATVTFIKWKMWRIAMKTLNLETMHKYMNLYPAEKWFFKAQFSPDPDKDNRFLIDKIIES